MSTLEQGWDRARDLAKHEPSPRHQKRAVIELVGYCHGLIAGGAFGPEIERALRIRVNTVCVEFGMERLPAPKVPA